MTYFLGDARLDRRRGLQWIAGVFGTLGTLGTLVGTLGTLGLSRRVVAIESLGRRERSVGIHREPVHVVIPERQNLPRHEVKDENPGCVHAAQGVERGTRRVRG